MCCFGDEEGKETAQQWGRTTNGASMREVENVGHKYRYLRI